MSGEIERRKVNTLTQEERAHIAADMHEMYVKGETKVEMMRKHGLTRNAVNTLLHEAAAYIRELNQDSRMHQVHEYRRFYGRMAAIEPDDASLPAIVRSTAPQIQLGIMTRIDKLLGHETAGDYEGQAEGYATLVQRAQQSGYFDMVNTNDLADFGEVEDAEVVEDDDT